jgi:hypothetical protein
MAIWKRLIQNISGPDARNWKTLTNLNRKPKLPGSFMISQTKWAV